MAVRVLIIAEPGEGASSLEQQLAEAALDTLLATSCATLLELAREHLPDVILLDDRAGDPVGSGFQRLLAADPATADTPLLRTSSFNRAALIARVRSAARLKALHDEIRVRQATGGLLGATAVEPVSDDLGATVALIDDGTAHMPALLTMLSSFGTVIALPPEGAVDRLRRTPCDIILLGLAEERIEGLRTVSQLRSQPETRRLPILAFVEGEGEATLSKGFDFGIDDGITLPAEWSSLGARIQALLHDNRLRARLQDQLRSSARLSAVDAVTGLYHRHFMVRHLGNLIARARAGNRPLSLLLVDVDGFGHVNEAVGRAASDAVLAELAHRVASSARAGDLSARCDGQRFAVILPGGGGDVARVVADRLRKVIGDTPVQGHAITASIGVASLRSEDDGAEAVLSRASEALLVAKHIGRNRVVGGAQEAAA